MKGLLIETIAIGDELLTGKISDTNTTFVADLLFQHGLRLRRSTSVLDDGEEIRKALLESAERAHAVVVFGGLGPTSDDRTAEGVAHLLRCSLVEHGPSKEKLISSYQSRNRPVTEQAIKQALYPEKAIPLSNPRGMACGFRYEMGKASYFFLPGVPEEMMVMFQEHVLPIICGMQEKEGRAPILSRTWRCLNLFESDLQRLLDPIEARLPALAWIGYRTVFPENHLTLYLREEQADSRAQFEMFASEIQTLLKPYAYSDANEELEHVIYRLLKEKGLKIAFAESCTGGLAVQRMTRVAGSSEVVWGGVVVYQVEAKEKLLGVQIDRPQDAVSSQCTVSLANRLLKESGCDVAAAVTGYAGPTGGTKEDPVGTVYLCVRHRHGRQVEKKLKLPNRRRELVQWAASTYLLNAVLEVLNS